MRVEDTYGKILMDFLRQADKFGIFLTNHEHAKRIF